MTVRLGRLLALGGIVAIMAVTLRPGDARDPSTSFWCLTCAGGVADLLRNILLFMPLGAGLRLAGWRTGPAIALGMVLSAGIELAQFIVPGRDPSAADIIANTLGTAAAAALAANAGAWLRPAPRRAYGLAGLWVVGAILVLWGGPRLATPALPESQYYGQWTPHLGHLEWYPGTLTQARLGSLDLPEGRLATPAVRAALLARDTLVVEGVAGPPTKALSPVFSIADDRGREILLVGAAGEDLVLRYRDLAVQFRLQPTSQRFRGFFRQFPEGTAFSLRATPLDPDGCVIAGGRSWCGPRGFASGWAFVVPESWVGNRMGQQALSALWMAFLVLPPCYWFVRARRGA